MKFTLLVQAGMTVRNTFRKMASDYKNKNEKRIAYEEIVTACHEMESGISEMEAYRRFGERCGHVKYKTFATLLIQNLQKGSRHMGEMLEKESVEAWDDRKRKAKVQGEAGNYQIVIPNDTDARRCNGYCYAAGLSVLLWINPIRRPIFIFKKKSAKGNFSG